MRVTQHIVIENLCKMFGEVAAVNDVNIRVEEGTILTLLGPSGCGKTTTLRCVAGLEKPDKGEIHIGNDVVFSSEEHRFVPPDKRNIGMVFQSYAVWPHMSVFSNVAYPLRARKMSKENIESKVIEALKLVRLQDFAERYPTQLSGGQQQRVALARTLVYEPQVLLLDEPLSNLDAKLRESMRFEIKELQRKLGITALYVTHDQEEALVISDTICLMEAGRVIQMGTPVELYDLPRSKFAADFIGKTNFMEGEITGEEHVEGETLEFCRVRTDKGLEIVSARTSPDSVKGKKVLVCVRPELINFHSEDPGERINKFHATISKRTFLGDRFDYRLKAGEQEIRALASPSVRFEEGDSVYLDVEPRFCSIITR